MSKVARHKVLREYRERLANGEEMICGICKQLIIGKVSADHIEPLSRGGEDKPDNLQPAHKFCNTLKDNFYMTELIEVIKANYREESV